MNGLFCEQQHRYLFAPLRVVLLSVLVMLCVPFVNAETNSDKVERWGIFELSLNGPTGGNPFVDVEFSTRFSQGDRSFEPSGFYDGNGIYRVRFMPDQMGAWEYVTRSNRAELNGKKGTFTCVKPSEGNHGPVGVVDTYHLAYADGTPHFSIGTTCYAWAHQGKELEEQTLKTLRTAPFNKMRMCVFPKSYTYNQNEPQYYPYEGKPLKDWDFTRFNPEFFQHFEKRVGDLLEMGIEADLILFHEYDRWNFSRMNAEQDDLYIRYVVARFAAYRNVWWSLANEYDLMENKKMSDWDRFFQIIRDNDPYGHLRGIHNCRAFYDHTKPWVTHVSIQSDRFPEIGKWRDQYKKPLIFDECKYEGDVPQGWGNLSAQQMTRRFWLGTIGDAYVGHGETYKHPQDILWWSKGGVLHGESPARIAFLKKIMEKTPYWEMTADFNFSKGNSALVKPGAYYLVYFTATDSTVIDLPGKISYKVDGIDTWNMTEAPLGSASPGKFSFTPPQADYLLRLTPYQPGEKMRPEAKASAEPTEGTAPLQVRFSTRNDMQCRWDFGDGTTSEERSPTHLYEKPGLYSATLTVTDKDGGAASTVLSIAADRPSGSPIVRFGFPDGNYPKASEIHGNIPKGEDGSFDFGAGEPWNWITVGENPLQDLEGLRSFTILGWLCSANFNTGAGGNRVLFTLNNNHSGMDLVAQKNGSLRLSVNEWPDNIKNDSSPGVLKAGEWTFFAVTYDSTKPEKNVHWYFGSAEKPASLDRATNYQNGPTGTGSGHLAIGNFNQTLRSAGLDRQFRGKIRGLEIYGSRISSKGALLLDGINKLKK